MTAAASRAQAVATVLDDLVRKERGRLLSALIARVRDFSLAEEALQEALISALAHWSRNGLPRAPEAWLLQVAWRKALDRIRQRRAQAGLAGALVPLMEEAAIPGEAEAIPDERLRLIFTCCHPAIERKSQIALTLRTLGGLSTAEIARAFLDQEATMGQRLSRARAKIAAARIPFAVPGPDQWGERLGAVLAVVYLIFNAGYTAGPAAGESGGRDLSEEAIWLARLLDRLRPSDPEIEGFLALLLLTHARHGARTGADGATVSLADQNRSLWDRAMIAEGLERVERALARRAPGPFQIKAAIAACHCEGESSDWAQIVRLYESLMQYEPTPVVRLNHAVAMAEAGDAGSGLALIEALAGQLAGYQPFHAARAELLARAGHAEGAMAEYRQAIALTASPADAAFLRRRMQRLGV